MLRVTRGQQLTTAITGSYPRPLWYEVNLRGQSFKSALGDSMFREQYIGEIEPAVAVGHDVEAGGLLRVDDGVGRVLQG